MCYIRGMPSRSESRSETHQAARPRIGITIGDAAGIGPEVVIKALAESETLDRIRPVVIGDLKHLRKLAAKFGVDLEFSDVDDVVPPAAGSIQTADLKNLPEDTLFGHETAECGRAAGEYIVHAVELWKAGKVDAIATAPISKRSLSMGGFDFPGHTEFLAALTGTERFAMSFFAGSLRVVLVSTHVPLRKAIDLVTEERLISLIRFSADKLEELLGRKVRIAVAGLNPHASEKGMFGTEEAERMVPAIERCRDDLGIDVSGPYSPDTIFLRCYRGEFDVVVAAYHDQATIAVKSLSFGKGVNVTLGLPLIRTSVDHGTAFDIAGKGVADCSSMCEAIKLAGELAAMRLGHAGNAIS